LCSDKITGGTFRSDGKLLISGLANGIVNVYEPLKKINLRSYKAHKLQVNCVDISKNFVNFASGSNDMSIKIYNLSEKKPIFSMDNCHNDYITSIRYLDENTLISGSYDKLLKLWDTRTVKNTLHF
jgi:WD40 repeat protein